MAAALAFGSYLAVFGLTLRGAPFEGLLATEGSAVDRAQAAALAPAQSEEGKTSVRSGVYTAAQAERGAQIFEERCTTCHQQEQFVGPKYMSSWTGQPAHSLFDLIRRTMPEDNPSSLQRQEYADLLAYIFKINGMPAGETELKDSDSELKQVIIEGPYGPNPGGADSDGSPRPGF